MTMFGVGDGVMLGVSVAVGSGVDVKVDVGDDSIVGVNVSVADATGAGAIVLDAGPAGFGVHPVKKSAPTSSALSQRYRSCFRIFPLSSMEILF